MVILLLACRPPGTLPESVRSHALELAEQVDGDAVFDNLQALVHAHSLEEPVWIDESGAAIELLGLLPHRRVQGAAFVVQELEALGLEPVLEDLDRGGIETRNVYVDVPGERDELVLVSAHHDVWFTGADDDSSGVVVMLEVARLIQDQALHRTVRLISFDQEEPGLHGSRRHYAAHAGEPMVAALFLDGLGFSGPQLRSLPGFDMPDQGDFLVLVANDLAEDHVAWGVELGAALSVPVHGAMGPNAWGYPGLSRGGGGDHVPAWEADVPAMMITDTGPLRNPHYHTEDDLPEHLDPAFLRGSAQLIVAMTVALAQAPS